MGPSQPGQDEPCRSSHQRFSCHFSQCLNHLSEHTPCNTAVICLQPTLPPHQAPTQHYPVFRASQASVLSPSPVWQPRGSSQLLPGSLCPQNKHSFSSLLSSDLPLQCPGTFLLPWGAYLRGGHTTPLSSGRAARLILDARGPSLQPPEHLCPAPASFPQCPSLCATSSSPPPLSSQGVFVWWPCLSPAPNPTPTCPRALMTQPLRFTVATGDPSPSPASPASCSALHISLPSPFSHPSADQA